MAPTLASMASGTTFRLVVATLVRVSLVVRHLCVELICLVFHLTMRRTVIEDRNSSFGPPNMSIDPDNVHRSCELV